MGNPVTSGKSASSSTNSQEADPATGSDDEGRHGTQILSLSQVQTDLAQDQAHGKTN